MCWERTAVIQFLTKTLLHRESAEQCNCSRHICITGYWSCQYARGKCCQVPVMVKKWNSSRAERRKEV